MSDTKHPNIIIIYADDLGFGDVSCYGANDIPTPNLDKLAEEGLKFHQGYATAATCTPSRYSLLTGSYPWRNPDAAVLPGDAPQIIGIRDNTMPKMLQKSVIEPVLSVNGTLVLGTAISISIAKFKAHRTMLALTIRISWPQPTTAYRVSTSTIVMLIILTLLTQLK